MKFRWKLTLSMLCLLSLIFSVGASALISLSFESALAREQRAAQDSYRMLLSTLQVADELGAWRSNRQLSNLLGQLSPRGSSGWAALVLTDENGGEIYRQGEAAAHFRETASADDSHNITAYFLDGTGRHYLQISGCITVADKRNTLTMAYDISSIYEARARLQSAYYIVFAVMLVVCGALIYLVALYLTRPLGQLSRATLAIAAGDFSSRANLRQGDEIGAVGADFDAMAARMEQYVQQLQDAMERQEQFIGSFTHELKTPMTAIIGYADLLREQALTPAEQQDAANYIFSEARRLERLSLKLLDILVAEHTEPTLTPNAPAALLSDVTEHLSPSLAAAGITLSQTCEDGLCLMDPDLVRSLLINLIDNARKAMPQGGAIALSGVMTPDGCRLTVADTGCGIPPSAVQHLTEAFYRVDKSRSRAQGGAGLGLTLCARIAALHGGTLQFESEPDKGTRVIAELKGGRA